MLMQPIITLTSDLKDDFAKAQLELVVHAINPNIKFIVGSNEITPFSIIEGAFILSKFYALAPKGSIHIVVVDPEVGSKRQGVIIQTKNYWFVGPDNGVLYKAASEDRIKKVFIIKEKQLNKDYSTTFHGRDIFAKAAALLSLSISPLKFSQLGDIHKLQILEFKPYQVVHIDTYGNIKLGTNKKTFITGDQLKVSTSCKDIIATYCQTFSDVDCGQFLVYRGSNSTLEIAQNLGSAAQELGVKVGDIVKITKIRIDNCILL